MLYAFQGQWRKCMFDYCCSKPHLMSTIPLTTPIPFHFTTDKEDWLKLALYYAPNIESHLSKKIEELEKTYAEIAFVFALYKLGMDEEKDFHWYMKKTSIDAAEWTYFHSSFCDNCQKFVIVPSSDTPHKLIEMFRVTRNCIAHGDFTITNNLLLGFNEYKGSQTAIVKVNLNTFAEIITALCSINWKTILIQYAFERLGYSVIQLPDNKTGSDLCIEKEGKKYYVEIKSVSLKTANNKFTLENISDFSDKTNLIDEDAYQIVIIDSHNEKKDNVIPNDRIIVLDKTKIQKLFNGEDVLKPKAQDSNDSTGISDSEK